MASGSSSAPGDFSTWGDSGWADSGPPQGALPAVEPGADALDGRGRVAAEAVGRGVALGVPVSVAAEGRTPDTSGFGFAALAEAPWVASVARDSYFVLSNSGCPLLETPVLAPPFLGTTVFGRAIFGLAGVTEGAGGSAEG